MEQDALWDTVCKILSNHFKAGQGCSQTVNRLWTKNVSERRPQIEKSSSTVYIEKWSLDRLWELIKPTNVTENKPHSTDEPPIVVRWKGKDYRIDGRRRINHLKRNGDIGPHEVLVIDIGYA